MSYVCNISLTGSNCWNVREDLNQYSNGKSAILYGKDLKSGHILNCCGWTSSYSNKIKYYSFFIYTTLLKYKSLVIGLFLCMPL